MIILGAGAAGVGIARQVRVALQGTGLAGDALTRALALVEVDGLLVQDGPPLDGYQLPFAWPAPLARACGLAGRHDLEAVVRALEPTVLIGACGQGGAFSKAVVQAMATHAERPVILPLSNPTSQSEGVPADMIAWTAGRALVATGSPFEPVSHAGRTLRIGQCNNAFIFPGIGLGALVAGASEVSDGMFRAAAECLAAEVSADDLSAGALYPPVRDLRRVATRIAAAVVRTARDAGLGPWLADEDIAQAVAVAQWESRYPSLEPGSGGFNR